MPTVARCMIEMSMQPETISRLDIAVSQEESPSFKAERMSKRDGAQYDCRAGCAGHQAEAVLLHQPRHLECVVGDTRTYDAYRRVPGFVAGVDG